MDDPPDDIAVEAEALAGVRQQVAQRRADRDREDEADDRRPDRAQPRRQRDLHRERQRLARQLEQIAAADLHLLDQHEDRGRVRATDHRRQRRDEEDADVDAVSVREERRGDQEDQAQQHAAQQLQRPGGVAKLAVEPVAVVDYVLLDPHIGQQFDPEADRVDDDHYAEDLGREQIGEDDVEPELQPGGHDEGARRPDELAEIAGRGAHRPGADRSRAATGASAGRRARTRPWSMPIAITFHVTSE